MCVGMCIFWQNFCNFYCFDKEFTLYALKLLYNFYQKLFTLRKFIQIIMHTDWRYMYHHISYDGAVWDCMCLLFGSHQNILYFILKFVEIIGLVIVEGKISLEKWNLVFLLHFCLPTHFFCPLFQRISREKFVSSILSV